MNKDEIRKLAIKLLKHYKLNNWKFDFNDKTLAIAQCDYFHKTIWMSNKYYTKYDQKGIKNILIHEIAHTELSYTGEDIIKNVFVPHREKFWKVFVKIGGKLDMAEKIGCKIWDYITLPYHTLIFTLILPFAIMYGIGTVIYASIARRITNVYEKRT